MEGLEQMGLGKEIKQQFLHLLKEESSFCFYESGIRKLEIKDNILFVYSTRPKLLIGKEGKFIDLLSSKLGIKIISFPYQMLAFNDKNEL